MAPTTGVISDLETMGEKADMTHEELVHLAELTDEEKILEKKLLRRIDSLIMPLVVLVYLLNYIDRYEVSSLCLDMCWVANAPIETTTLLRNSRVLRMTWV